MASFKIPCCTLRNLRNWPVTVKGMEHASNTESAKRYTRSVQGLLHSRSDLGIGSNCS